MIIFYGILQLSCRGHAPAELQRADMSITADLPPEQIDGSMLRSDSSLPLVWHHSQLKTFLQDAAQYQIGSLSYTRRCEDISPFVLDKVTSDFRSYAPVFFELKV